MNNCGQTNDHLFNHIIFFPPLLASGCMTSWKIWQRILWRGLATSEAISFWDLEVMQPPTNWNAWRYSASLCSNKVLSVPIFFLCNDSSFIFQLSISVLLDVTDIRALGFWSKLWLSLISILHHHNFNACPYFLFIYMPEHYIIVTF